LALAGRGAAVSHLATKKAGDLWMQNEAGVSMHLKAAHRPMLNLGCHGDIDVTLVFYNIH
jgi:hypothetical protein